MKTMTDDKKVTGYPSIDKPWLKYYTEEAIAALVPECSIYRNIYDNNKEYLNNIAFNYFGRKINYANMFNEVEKIAKSLNSYGIGCGDTVNMLATSAPEIICIVLACSKIGALANFINPMFTPEQIADRINDTKSEWLFVLDRTYSYAATAIKKTCIKNVVVIPIVQSMPIFVKTILKLKNDIKIPYNDKKIQFITYKQFLNHGCEYKGRTEVTFEKERPVVMVYSSGTTGASKGIVLTNEGINAIILNDQKSSFNLKRGFTFLQMIPVWFSTGIVLSVLMPLGLGMTVILEPVFSKENFAKGLAKHSPNLTLAATSLWVYAVHSKELRNVDLSGMTYPISGGEKITKKTAEDINDFLQEHGSKVHIVVGWGMCELGSAATNSTPLHEKYGTAGHPILGVTVSAFDPETNEEKKYNERGELRVLTPAHMKEYYKNPSATEKFFWMDNKGEKWCCTGDLGYVDEDGDVSVLGRIGDSFISKSGRRIFFFDIEEIIYSVDGVDRCKAIDFKDENENIIVVAHIALKKDAIDSDLIIQRIKGKCSEMLDLESVPQKYKLWDSLPVNTSGKLDNEALRKNIIDN